MTPTSEVVPVQVSAKSDHVGHDVSRKAPDTSEIGYPCQECGHHYVTDMLVPDDVWEVIKPEGKDIGAGLLCPTCIMDRASDRLGWSVGFVYPERHGTAVTAGKAAPASEVVARLATIIAEFDSHIVAAIDEPGDKWDGFVEVKISDLRSVAALISSLVAERDTAQERASLWAKEEGQRQLELAAAERLLAEAREALRPFVVYAPEVCFLGSGKWTPVPAIEAGGGWIGAEDFRKARATLSTGGVNG